VAKPVGAVMVVGGGIAGIQASLDLAEAGYFVYLVERSPAIGGVMPMLDKTFPTNDCSMCILSPKLVECGRHLNIKVLTLAEVEEVTGEPGHFRVRVRQHPRYVDIDKCTGCGECAEECPVEVEDEFNQGLNYRKAIYRPYAQAYPNAFCIDKENCTECMTCSDVCQAGAPDHEMEEQILELEVGSIILCPGFKTYDAGQLEYYGYGKYRNVLTSLEFERILSASGPYQGHLMRPSDEREPQKIAWIQCVGSRNVAVDRGYCSAVCCMYAIKEAIIAKEHSKGPLDTAIFFMDMRTYGKGFERYYERAKAEGVRFIRSRIYQVQEAENGNLRIRYAEEDGTAREEEFDLVILSVGLEPSEGVRDLIEKLGLESNRYGFARAEELTAVASSRPGIYVTGVMTGPKDIPETVMQASAAAGESMALLAAARGSMVQAKEYPPERDVTGEPPRIGVFVCHCGVNIAGVVNIDQVVAHARTLPHVVYATNMLYTCSQDNQNAMRQAIEEHNLNRVVVAACTPRTHRPLFQETLREAGLNPHLFEMANIRDQNSWVHMHEPAKATEKAKDLVRMAVAKAVRLEPIPQVKVGVTPAALVIGGGVAGMNAALSLAEQGFEVHLVEKEAELGGVARRLPWGLNGEDVPAYLNGLIGQVEGHPRIKVYKGANIEDVTGYVGNFVTRLSTGEEIRHGVAIIAIGGREYRPTEYLYGQDNRVMTFLELGEELAKGNGRLAGARNVVLIQCVGSREEPRLYCSRVCCGKAVKLALEIKERDPEANVYVLYRDVRTYGFLEDYYQEARARGVVFIRYTREEKPRVEVRDGQLMVTARDHVLGVPVEIRADAIGLGAAILPPEDAGKLSQFFKVPLNEDGFFLEAHLKLRPVDFPAEGVFLCGLAHGPKALEENIAQARAAAGRAGTVLSQPVLESRGVFAVVQPEKCAACLTCLRLCPFNAPRIVENVAQIEPVLCQGCGTCAGECPNKAIALQGYKDRQLAGMVAGLFAEV